MWKKEIHIGPNGKSINRKEEKTTETWREFRIFLCTVLNNLTLMKNIKKKIRKLYLLQKRILPWHIIQLNCESSFTSLIVITWHPE